MTCIWIWMHLISFRFILSFFVGSFGRDSPRIPKSWAANHILTFHAPPRRMIGQSQSPRHPPGFWASKHAMFWFLCQSTPNLSPWHSCRLHFARRHRFGFRWHRGLFQVTHSNFGPCDHHLWGKALAFQSMMWNTLKYQFWVIPSFCLCSRCHVTFEKRWESWRIAAETKLMDVLKTWCASFWSKLCQDILAVFIFGLATGSSKTATGVALPGVPASYSCKNNRSKVVNEV